MIIDKPQGLTSHDVVNQLRRLYGTKRVGHTGTLDPDATGVLVVCLGYATRLAEYLSSARKAYRAEFQFGIETDTQDASGRVIAEQDALAVTEEEVRVVASRFTGRILQTPPMVSAVHHEGKRLYELAREGITVERQAREIEIERIEIHGFLPDHHPCLTLEIVCSTGTYIRTLASDMGLALGVGGMMKSLRRLWVGDPKQPFTLEEAWTLESLKALSEQDRLAESVLPVRESLRGWRQIRLNEAEELRLRHGQSLPFCEGTPFHKGDLGTDDENSLVAVITSQEEVCAIARFAEGLLTPVKVLLPIEVVSRMSAEERIG